MPMDNTQNNQAKSNDSSSKPADQKNDQAKGSNQNQTQGAKPANNSEQK